MKQLELLLRAMDSSRFEHEILLYRRTPGAGPLAALAPLQVLWREVSSAAIRHEGGRPRLPASVRDSQLLQDLVSFSRARQLVRPLQRVIRSGAYDAVHINNTFTYQPASVCAAARSAIPIVAHVRNPVRLTPLSGALARRVKRFVAVNPTIAASLRVYKCTFIGDGIEARDASPNRPAELRNGASVPGKLIGSVGRLDRQKGYEFLIRAAEIVRRKRSDAFFAIAGEGPLRPSLEALVNKLGLSSVVRFLGFREDAQNVASAFDLFICPSLWEGGPTSLLEAMAAGTPVISTSVGIAPEVVVHGKSGWLVEPGNAQQLAGAILRALEATDEERARVASRGRTSVAPFQDLRSLASRFEDILEEAVTR